MKYGGLGLQDEMLIHLMCTKLQGYPKAVVETLPRSSKEGSYVNFVEALRAKLKENEVAQRTETYIKLKQLRKRSSVTDYCLELEDLTRKVYPDASEKELSMIRAGELITQLTEWKEYVQIFNTLEQSKQEEAYEKLKNLAQSIERSQQVAKAVRFSIRASQENNLSFRQSGSRDHIPPDNYKNEHQLHTVACSICKKQGHFKRDCWKARGVRNKECPALPSSTPGNSAPFDRQSSSRNQKEQGPKVQTFTTTLDKWECGEIQVKATAQNELFGKQTVAKVDLLGMSRNALLDTGSQISILPLKMLREAQRAGFDIDKDVEEVPVPNQRTIYDASGNPMEFKGAIRLTIKTKNVKPQRVAMFVRKSNDNMITLGTNVLEKLNLVLKEQNDTREQKNPKGRGRNQQSFPRQNTKLNRHNSETQRAVVVRRAVVSRSTEQNQRARERMEQNYMRIPMEKASSTHPKLVNEWNGPFRVIDVSDNSALVTSKAGGAEPLKVQFDLLRKLPIGMDNAPVQTVRQRKKRGRPKKSRGSHSKTACFRVDVGPSQEDPLHLFHPCTCKIFRSKAKTALPSLRSEVVEELTGTAKGFDARVVDAYGTIDTAVPLGHPASSLEISPRRDDDRFHSRQRAVFLKQVRKFAMRTLSQPVFFPAKRDKRDDAADTNASSTKPKDEPLKKKPKIVKPHVMYVRDAKAERNRHAHLMKQK
uniref:CCHC-type domain-containing protein n=1 Tax=Haemonchus contortus TaxID=6289 RepID=A0A7I4YDN3_HAECO